MKLFWISFILFDLILFLLLFSFSFSISNIYSLSFIDFLFLFFGFTEEPSSILLNILFLGERISFSLSFSISFFLFILFTSLSLFFSKNSFVFPSNILIFSFKGFILSIFCTLLWRLISWKWLEIFSSFFRTIDELSEILLLSLVWFCWLEVLLLIKFSFPFSLLGIFPILLNIELVLSSFSSSSSSSIKVITSSSILFLFSSFEFSLLYIFTKGWISTFDFSKLFITTMLLPWIFELSLILLFVLGIFSVIILEGSFLFSNSWFILLFSNGR